MCRKCQGDIARRSDLANPTRARAKRKRWKKRNPDKVRARQRIDSRLAYQRHGSKIRAAARAYGAANKDKIRARYTSPRGRLLRRISEGRRRARLAAAPATLTPDQWLAILAAFDGLCAYCDSPWEHVDHVVPVARGGGTTADNVVPACEPCNRAKNARALEAFCRERGLDAGAIRARASTADGQPRRSFEDLRVLI